MSTPRSVHGTLKALQAKGLSRLESQMLVLHALGLTSTDRAWLLTHDTHPIDAGQFERLEHLAEQRQSGVPMAYLIGRKRFHAIDLHIDPRVLDPRDDTETLVDWALHALPEGPQRVLDLGTGSGAIALALQHQRPAWEVYALDHSAGEIGRAHV